MDDKTRGAAESYAEHREAEAGTDERGRALSQSQVRWHSNGPAIAARRSAIRAARDGAEALRFVAVDDAEIEARLAKFRGAIPGPDTLKTLQPVL